MKFLTQTSKTRESSV